ncbi:N-acetylneuraminate synthase family protein [Microbacterium sp. CJ77]|uniref:N-acetylneuraminate synthase family protein n=1 Tax=Microbacterium sp. CJ77 TaxID=2079201 RepID=UPI000CD96184|nr:N-acetylneuraminate synthase family protein [Microbacterium sp. CJ77]
MKIADRDIGLDHPTYFVADIAASHDGSLERALDLIHLAAEAGADAAKFQNFTAREIVSDRGFRELGAKLSHQSTWKKSVVEVYEEASIPHAWTPHLKRACDEAGIHFFSAAYDLAAVDMLDPFVPAFKIGSGDIDWLEAIEYTAAKGKPILLATGAADLDDVVRGIDAVRKYTDQLVLMQCNTNYTASVENFRYLNLNVLKSYGVLFPDAVLGLSDHTPGHASTLGAIALGARVIEKHFTDDTGRDGPDHKFSMDPTSWREMVHRSRELELALGGTLKKIEENELETRVVQRRAVRAREALPAGHVLVRGDLAVLRPAAPNAVPASQVRELLGRTLTIDLEADSAIRWTDVAGQ